MELVRPDIKYEKKWHEIVEEFRHDEKTIGLWKVLGEPDDLAKCARIAADHSRGLKLIPGWVPYDLLWLVDGKDIVGIASIRHKLTDDLLLRGGHIGYEIVPSKRGQGYGNKILELSLARCRGLGLKKVLVTSFEKNIASRKVIETNGGILENKIMAPGETDITYRYWISLDK